MILILISKEKVDQFSQKGERTYSMSHKMNQQNQKQVLSFQVL